MGFYGNIINYFTAAFRRFKFKKAEKVVEMIPTSTNDQLTFDFSNGDQEAYIDFDYNNDETIDLKLNLEGLKNKLSFSYDRNSQNLTLFNLGYNKINEEETE